MTLTIEGKKKLNIAWNEYLNVQSKLEDLYVDTNALGLKAEPHINYLEEKKKNDEDFQLSATGYLAISEFEEFNSKVDVLSNTADKKWFLTIIQILGTDAQIEMYQDACIITLTDGQKLNFISNGLVDDEEESE
jgi:hypothetical protein